MGVLSPGQLYINARTSVKNQSRSGEITAPHGLDNVENDAAKAIA